MANSHDDDGGGSDQSLTEENQKLKLEVARLRILRDNYRTLYAEAVTANDEFATANEKLKKQIVDLEQATAKKEKNEDDYPLIDSDTEVFDIKPLKKALLLKRDPASDKVTTTIGGSNPWNPDVPHFYGNQKEWEGWQLHLQSKFRASARLFPNEQSKIDYIRDHCKSTAFDAIEAGCISACLSDRYSTAQEVVEHLDLIFGALDSIEATLHDPEFPMNELD